MMEKIPFILIIDYGSQLTQLIARRIREQGFFSRVTGIIGLKKELYEIRKQSEQENLLMGIILSGGPDSVEGQNSPAVDKFLFDLRVPILGICYGMQAIAKGLGGAVELGRSREFGKSVVRAHGRSKLLDNIQDFTNDEGHGLLDVWMSHGDSVTKVPPGFKIIASSSDCEIAGIADENNHFYGLQFHPEASHTKQGKKILERFCGTICNCPSEWTMKKFSENKILEIKKIVGQDKVLLGLSGGVDSSVVAKLLDEAIGKQLICIFVDTGLLRRNEAAAVMEIFENRVGGVVKKIDAGKIFFEKLKGVFDPEEKRKIIGGLFISIFEREAKRFSDVVWLAQGTIYPDIIESAGGENDGSTKKIKSHHNVGGLPDRLALKLLEPIKVLFKDEVRQLGLELGLERNIIFRHPFPGPGLAIRVLGEVTFEKVSILQSADEILLNLLKKTTVVERDVLEGLTVEENIGKKWYDATAQAFSVFLPLKTVGVKGDDRSYDWIIGIRIVNSTDFMTANASRLPYELLEQISSEIINKVQNVSRVVLDISNKPPATIEWE